MKKGGRNLSYQDRQIIEKMRLQGEKITVIANIIGCHRTTIYNELKRGGTPYCAEVAQKGVKRCEFNNNDKFNIDKIKSNELIELEKFLKVLERIINYFNNSNITQQKALLNKLLKILKLNDTNTSKS